jgi:hypothetical protein
LKILELNLEPFVSEASFMLFNKLFAFIFSILDNAFVSELLCLWARAAYFLAGFPHHRRGLV